MRPLRAERPRIEPQQSCLEALQEVCRAATKQIQHNWRVVLQNDDPEGPHQMRVGLRRLRAALRLFRPIATGAGLRDLDRSVRDLARCVGLLRDADVLSTDIVGSLIRSHPQAFGVATLQAALAVDREEIRRMVREQLASDSAQRLRSGLARLPSDLKHLVRAKDTKNLGRPIGSVSGELLKRRWKKLAAYGRRIGHLSNEERHEMRKELKIFRYSVDVLAPLHPMKKVNHLIEEMSDLQNVFGYLNDVVTAEQLLQSRLNGASDPVLAHAAGFVIGWHSARAEQAWAEALSAWKRLEKAPRLW